VVFRGCRVFISASNPANNPNTGPAIVSATLESGFVKVKPVVAGNASAIDVTTDMLILQRGWDSRERNSCRERDWDPH
jgi:hypothetical protein